MTITLSNLIFNGTHGYTEKEKINPQGFCVTITLNEGISHAHCNDDISATIDYRKIKTIAQEVVEGIHCNLLETLSEKIAERIIDTLLVRSVRVEISKLDIWKQGMPSVSGIKERYFSCDDFVPIDIHHILKALHQTGAISVPFLPIHRRLTLLEEVKKYAFIPSIPPDSPLVRQEFSNYDDLSTESLFPALANEFYNHLIRDIPKIELQRLFPTPLTFTELRLQKYEKDSIGITPHREGKSKINLLCLFILKGKGVFGLCDDRAGSNTQLFDAPPGNVIIMRAPGFMGSDYQPFHFVRDIKEERITFGLRQFKI